MVTILKNVKVNDRAHYLLRLAAVHKGVNISTLASELVIERCETILGPLAQGAPPKVRRHTRQKN